MPTRSASNLNYRYRCRQLHSNNLHHKKCPVYYSTQRTIFHELLTDIKISFNLFPAIPTYHRNTKHKPLICSSISKSTLRSAGRGYRKSSCRQTEHISCRFSDPMRPSQPQVSLVPTLRRRLMCLPILYVRGAAGKN